MRKLAALAICTISFVVGYCAGWMYVDRVMVPRWIQEAPHDGQLGLGLLVYGSAYGALAGFAALALAIWLCRCFILRRPRTIATAA